MSKLANLTLDGQITIPEDVRSALGLRPGEPVEIDWRGGAEAVIRKGSRQQALPGSTASSMAARLQLVAAKYAHLRAGRSTEEIMAELREPLP